MSEHFARNVTEDTPDPVQQGAYYTVLPLDTIEPSPLNPRKEFDEDYLRELAASIEVNGLMSPILVRPRAGGGYWIIAGECRYRAHRLLGRAQIPVSIRVCTDEEHLRLSIIENLQRRDVKPVEQARGFAQLVDLGMPQAEIAGKVGCAPSTISNAIRLLSLPAEVVELVSAGKLPVATARALIKYAPFPVACRALADICVEKGIPSKEMEEGVIAGWRLQSLLKEHSTIANLNDWQTYGRYFNARASCADCPARQLLGDCCPDPACAEGKKQDAIAEKERRREEIEAESRFASDILYTKTVDVEYELLSFDGALRVPTGCRREECEHWRRAIDNRTNAYDSVELCLDPHCFRSMKATQASEKRRDDKATRAEKLQRAADTLRDINHLAQPAVTRALVLATLDTWKGAASARLAYAAQAADFPPELIAQLRKDVHQRELPALIDALSGIHLVSLLTFVTLARFQEELRMAENGYGSTPLLDAFLTVQQSSRPSLNPSNQGSDKTGDNQ